MILALSLVLVAIDGRLANRSGSQRCAYCVEGLVVVEDGEFDALSEAELEAIRGMSIAERRKRGLFRAVYGEAYGPCPFCELGYLIEFPQNGVGPWGPDGFWRGKRAYLSPIDTGSRSLPMEEKARRMRELMARFEGGGEAAAEKTEPLVEAAPGRCDDCGEDSVHASRYVYGRFTLCRPCVESRARHKAPQTQLSLAAVTDA